MSELHRIGRPIMAKQPHSGRVPLGLRVSPGTKAKLIEAALQSGRSISQECELRIEMGFASEPLNAALAKLDALELHVRDLMRMIK